MHDQLARHPRPDNIIVGIRPEHLEDAALLDGYARIRALSFPVRADMVESLGADKYVHFTIEGAGAEAAQLAELAADSGSGVNEFVARVAAESTAVAGQQIQLAFDTTKLAIFDAATGLNLTRAEPEAPEEPVEHEEPEAPAESVEPAGEPAEE